MKTKTNEIIPLKFDGMFTEIFNNKDNVCILEEFISDYFGYKLEDVRGNIEIKPRLLKKGTYEENKKEVDLILTYKNEVINIEMSTGWDLGIIDRNIIFLSKIHSSQKYKNYYEIKPTIQINLLAFNYRNKLKSTLYLTDEEDGYVATKKFRMDIINMVKGKEMCYTGKKEIDKLIKWSKIFLSETKEELEKNLKETLSKDSKEILLSDVLRLSGDDTMMKEYKEKSKYQLEYESGMYYGKLELEKQHQNLIKEYQQLKENLKEDIFKKFESEKIELNNQKEELNNQKKELNNQKKELNNQKKELNNQKKELNNKINVVVKKLLNLGINIEKISESTGLSKEEIENLK